VGKTTSTVGDILTGPHIAMHRTIPAAWIMVPRYRSSNVDATIQIRRSTIGP
jgi:hypothetical protein